MGNGKTGEEILIQKSRGYVSFVDQDPFISFRVYPKDSPSYGTFFGVYDK